MSSTDFERSSSAAPADELSRLFRDCEPTERGPCPSTEQLLDTLGSKSEIADRRGVIEHLARCPACAEDWRIARELSVSFATEADLPGAVSGADTPRHTRPVVAWWAQPRWPLTAAAAALVLLAAGTFTTNIDDRRAPTQPEPGAFRNDATAVESSTSEHHFNWSDARMRWPAGPVGAQYELSFHRSDLTTIDLRIQAGSPGVTLAPADMAVLRGEGEFYWQVRTVAPDGRTQVGPTNHVQSSAHP